VPQEYKFTGWYSLSVGYSFIKWS